MKKLLLSITFSFLFLFSFSQISNSPIDLIACDDNSNDETEVFDLTINDLNILGTLDPNLYIISYHLSLSDAENDMNAIQNSNAYSNVTNPQTIFSRTFEINTGNYDVSAFDLFVNPLPSVEQVTPLELCDDFPSDDSAVFDLTMKTQELIGANTNVAVTFYETLTDAQSQQNPIVNPMSYTNVANPQVIYVAVMDMFSGCYSVGTLTIRVHPVPSPSPNLPDLVVCDDDGDGFNVFDLTENELLLLNGEIGVSVIYYATEFDAWAGTNALPNPSVFNNFVPYEQTIYASVINNVTGCLTVVDFGLVVDISCNYSLDITSIEQTLCTTNEDVDVQIDLTQQETTILNGLNPSTHTIVYYQNANDAELEVNAIINPTQYTTPNNNTTLFVRVDDTQSNDFAITTYNIIFSSGPEVFLPEVLTLCGDQNNFIGPDIVGDMSSYTFLWNTGETTSNIIVTQSGVYTLTVTENDTGCSTTVSTEVLVSSSPDLGVADDLTTCDPNENFDLTLNLPQILNGLDPSLFQITYFSSSGIISNPTQFTLQNSSVQSESITVQVQNIGDECFSVSSFDINFQGACPVVFSCSEGPIENTFCYSNINSSQGETPQQYTFESLDGTPLSIFFNEGQVEEHYDELVVLDSDGVTNLNANAPYGNNGDVSGLTFTSSGNTITIFVDADHLISCETHQYIPISYSVFCADPNALPFCNATLQTPENGEVDVNENIDLTWSSASGTVTGYKLSVGTNSGGTDVLDNVDVGNVLTYDLGTLEYDTIYYVTIISYNDNGDASGCEEQTFTTRVNPNQTVGCGDGPVFTTYCYGNNDTTEFNYQSDDGTPLTVFFNTGGIENTYDELYIVDSDGTILNPNMLYGNGGNFAGLSFTSTGDSITFRFDTDGSISCQTNSSCCTEQFNFVVACADPNAVPLCSSLTTPEDGETDVDENVVITWSSALGIVTGYKLSVGTSPDGVDILDNEDVGDVLTYDLGLLNFETSYYVTIIPYNDNGDAIDCNEQTFTTRANPFQTVVCGSDVVNTTYCYENNDDSEFSFQSSDGLPLTIVFNTGSTETSFDEVYVVDSDGTILNPNELYGNSGDFSGLTYTSTGDSLTVRFDSDFTISCAQGNSCCNTAFDFDVFCSSSVGFLQVNAFVDSDLDGIYDNDEFSFSNGYFTYEVNGDGIINVVNSSTGHFQIISANDTDVYDITFNLYEESQACYNITTAAFSNVSVATGSTITIDFPVVEQMSCEDLGVYLINNWAPPRPGFVHDNYLYFENLGFTAIASGTIEFVTDAQLVLNGVFEVDPNYTVTTTATGFTLDFVNLQPGELQSVRVDLYCPPTVPLDDIVTNTATYITDTNDMVVSNNYSTLSEVVVGSWDPNDIMESHGPEVVYDDFAASDEWLYYTVRFQNLGTAEAIFVRIEDQLHASLDETTFQMINSSHDYVVTRTGTDLEWFFGDINLPAEQDDAEGSIGFVNFRIKPKTGYNIGDVIPHSVAIYFDFNAPVITNTWSTTFIPPLSVRSYEKLQFKMYPNPAKENVKITLSTGSIGNFKVELHDIQGKLIQIPSIRSANNIELNVSSLTSGIYFVKLNNGSQSLVDKLVIE